MQEPYDCIIIGAGPGGLQAAIYLGRYNRNVLLLDMPGGRTRHAKYVENYLGLRATTGLEIVNTGMEQARSFNVKTERATVTRVSAPFLSGGETSKGKYFEVCTEGDRYLSRFVIVSSGGRENLLKIQDLQRFFGVSFFTCIDCDGYRTTGKKLLVMGNSANTVRLALAMKQMYTKDITLLLMFYEPPEDVRALLAEEGITLFKGYPKKLIGGGATGSQATGSSSLSSQEKGLWPLEALELQDGRVIPCEAVMSHFGYKLSEDFLKDLPLNKDPDGKYVTNRHFESTVDGLYMVGPLVGQDQIVIAAGEGAVAAIDINKRLLSV